MRNPLPFLYLSLIIAPGLGFAQQPAKDVESQLQAKYKDKIIKAKISMPGTDIHFDSTGKSNRNPESCESWTLCNVFLVEKVKIKDHAVTIEAQRVGVSFADGHPKYLRLADSLVAIEIDMDGDLTTVTAERVMCRVFLCGKDKFSDYLPYAWARYFDSQNSGPNPQKLANRDGVLQRQGQTKKLRASGGVMASKLISQARPSYPLTAKSYRQQGTVAMQAIIGRDGKIHDLYLVRPAGFGLDEEALRAVSKWVYRPTTLQGEPVDVETTINVNFQLSR